MKILITTFGFSVILYYFVPLKPIYDNNEIKKNLTNLCRNNETFGKPVAYPFGYGLSYTTFAYGRPTVKMNGNNVELTVSIKNTGDVEGKEAVQVYVSAPKSELETPAKELKSFAKTRSLKPGESETLKMIIPIRDLASYDEQGARWTVPAGTYTFSVAANIADVRGTTKATIKEYTEKTSDVLTPKEPLNLLRQN